MRAIWAITLIPLEFTFFITVFFYLFTITKPKQLIFSEHQFGFEREKIDAHSDIDRPAEKFKCLTSDKGELRKYMWLTPQILSVKCENL